MVERFGERLQAVGGVLHVVADLDAARARAAELVAGATVAGWGVEGVGRAAEAREAQVSLIVADLGVADTGAIAFAHGAGRPRAAGLLPDRQVALLAREDLVATMAEALGRLFGGPRVPGNVVFAAGPSRTADIEQRMMVGVHAPRSLDVVLHG